MVPPSSRRPPSRRSRLAACAVVAALVGPVAPVEADFDSAKKFFAENVRAPDWKARRSAYGAFQDHDGGPAAAAILGAVGAESHPVVLAAAAATLGGMRSEAARAAMTAALAGAKATERAVAGVALRTVRGADVDAALVAALGAPSPVAAGLAAAALGTPGRSGAADALAKALAHREPLVRAAAARSLGALGDRGALGPLAARLPVEKGVARGAVVAALGAVTRHDFGDDPAAWAALAAGADAATVARKPTWPPTFFGLPVTGERVVFVLDRSLQMSDPHAYAEEGKRDRLEALCTPKDGDRIPWRQLKTRLDLALAMLRHALAGLPAGTKVEIVCFAEDVQAVFGRKWVPVSAAARKTADEVLGKLETDDGINVYEALLAALDLGGPTDEKALKAGPEQVFLVLNNIPTKGEVADADAIERGIGFRARARGVTVSVVEMGANPVGLAAGLAKATGGVHLDLTR